MHAICVGFPYIARFLTIGSAGLPPVVRDEIKDEPCRDFGIRDRLAAAAMALAFDEKTAMRALYYSSAAYCDQSAIQNWSCASCGRNKAFEMHAVVFDSSTNTLGFVGADHTFSQSMKSGVHVCPTVFLTGCGA